MIDPVLIKRRLRIELSQRLGWRDIDIFGGVYCWLTPDEITVITKYSRISVGISVNEKFTFPAGTPADDVVNSVLVQLTFLK